MTDNELMNLAQEAMEKAYCPYSEFYVGAALITEDGSVYTGCNIENAAYGCCICAERCAVSDAVKNGHRKIVTIAVCGGKNGEIEDFCPPCGECRQVIREFSDKNSRLILTNGNEIKSYTIDEILPLSFTGDNLN